MKSVIELPGDKSISHRVALMAAIAKGPCRIRNYNTGLDCAATLHCLRQLGASIEGSLTIHPAPMRTPERPLDCGNSGSTMRMLTGLLAGQNVPATFIGDLSLLRRPMRRLAEPLRQMGAVIQLRDEEFAPIILEEGVKHSVVYRMPVASAQVKSAIMLAGLRFPGTYVSEPVRTRDHTERLFEYLQIKPGDSSVSAFEYTIPADPSSIAFFVAGALLRKDSEIRFYNVLMNPHRVAYLRKLQQAGAGIEITGRRLVQNEYVADLLVREGRPLTALRVLPEEVPSLIDEIPALSLLGTISGFEVSGASELRYKESDRIESMVSNLQALGIQVDEREDGYRVWPGNLQQGAATTFGDHRIAMAFAAAGLEIDDPDCVKVSFPEFFDLMRELGW